eukprot:gene9504-biopygen1682
MGFWRSFWRPLAILKIGTRQNSNNMGRQHGRSAPKIASRKQKKVFLDAMENIWGPWSHFGATCRKSKKRDFDILSTAGDPKILMMRLGCQVSWPMPGGGVPFLTGFWHKVAAKFRELQTITRRCKTPQMESLNTRWEAQCWGIASPFPAFRKSTEQCPYN